MIKMKFSVVVVLLLITALTACKQVALYERLQNIDKAAWNEQQVTSFNFDISDTVPLYNVYIVVRHTNLYPYRNIWLNVGVQQPGDTMRHQQFEFQLAAADRWLGTGMDDIYEHRARLFNQPVHFNKMGTVTFTLQHIMRQNPLPGVMQAGIRVEPVGLKP
jgi:gliding motility-associated lipoprotein GldH